MNILRSLNAIGATTLPEHMIQECEQEHGQSDRARYLAEQETELAVLELELRRKRLELQIAQLELERRELEKKTLKEKAVGLAEEGNVR